MSNVIKFFQIYEYVIYFVLGFGFLKFGWDFWKAWSDVRRAVFGLEHVNAQRKLNQSVVAIFLILLFGFTVLAVVTFSEDFLLTNNVPVPTQDVGNIVQVTLTAIQNPGEVTPTPLPTVALTTEGCIAGQIEISEPQSGQVIRGDVTVRGTVNVDNFGFYKLEIAEANQALWLTIQAGRDLVDDDVLVEVWDTSLIPPGGYVLQLVVTSSTGEVLPPCRIPVTIGASE